MKNIKNSHGNSQREHVNTIPDITIIDLSSPTTEEASSEPDENQEEPIRSRINMHIVFLIVFLLLLATLIGGLIYRFLNWGTIVDLDKLFEEGLGNTDTAMYDLMLPLLNSDYQPIYKSYGEDSTILFLGNAPFADGRDSEDNIVNMIREMTGATVYNCSVSGSYLAALNYTLDTNDYPMDIFNFYWLCQLITGDAVNQRYLDGLKTLGDAAPPEAMDVYNTLKGLDFNDVDVITIMYDASDYLAGHKTILFANETDIETFAGNLQAGIELLHAAFPNTRIIVLSPTYAFGIDDSGNYISSDIKDYGDGGLSMYVIWQNQTCITTSVTYVDNLYGTIHEDNASDYLIDNLHLNLDGRKKVAQRFVKALNYFENMKE